MAGVVKYPPLLSGVDCAPRAGKFIWRAEKIPATTVYPTGGGRKMAPATTMFCKLCLARKDILWWAPKTTRTATQSTYSGRLHVPATAKFCQRLQAGRTYEWRVETFARHCRSIAGPAGRRRCSARPSGPPPAQARLHPLCLSAGPWDGVHGDGREPPTGFSPTALGRETAARRRHRASRWFRARAGRHRASQPAGKGQAAAPAGNMRTQQRQGATSSTRT